MTDYIIPGYVPNGTADEFAWMDGFLKPEPWMKKAPCKQDPELFFPSVGDSAAKTAQAKAVCAACPVREQCLEYALANGEEFGIWGDTTERQRRRMRNQTP